MSCEHDLSERETACADGYCPLCSVERIVVLEASLRLIARKKKMDAVAAVSMRAIAHAALAPSVRENADVGEGQ